MRFVCRSTVNQCEVGRGGNCFVFSNLCRRVKPDSFKVINRSCMSHNSDLLKFYLFYFLSPSHFLFCFLSFFLNICIRAYWFKMTGSVRKTSFVNLFYLILKFKYSETKKGAKKRGGIKLSRNRLTKSNPMWNVYRRQLLKHPLDEFPSDKVAMLLSSKAPTAFCLLFFFGR